MTPIQIQQLNPAANNKRTEYAQSPLTFGRESSCDIIIAEDYVSRQHGELHYEKQQWTLVNKSTNGTEVNGKRITRRPAKLKDGDSISIGGNLVMRLTFAKPLPAVADETDNGPNTDEEAAAPKKKKLWVFIGIYFAAIIALFLFLSTLKTEEKKTGGLPPELSFRQIEDEIHAPVKALPTDTRAAAEQLQYATEAYNRRDVDIDALYVAYTAYRKAIAFSGRDTFDDSLDQRRYLEVQEQLTEQLTTQYKTAYNQLRNRNYQQAAESFRHLARLYPVNDRRRSRLFANIEDLIRASSRTRR